MTPKPLCNVGMNQTVFAPFGLLLLVGCLGVQSLRFFVCICCIVCGENTMQFLPAVMLWTCLSYMGFMEISVNVGFDRHLERDNMSQAMECIQGFSVMDLWVFDFDITPRTKGCFVD